MTLFDDLPDTEPDAPHFGGATYDPAKDGERLRTLLSRVFWILEGGAWWTLKDLAAEAGGSEAGVSARLRDLRKERFGGHRIDARRVVGAEGLWEYRLADPVGSTAEG